VGHHALITRVTLGHGSTTRRSAAQLVKKKNKPEMMRVAAQLYVLRLRWYIILRRAHCHTLTALCAGTVTHCHTLQCFAVRTSVDNHAHCQLLPATAALSHTAALPHTHCHTLQHTTAALPHTVAYCRTLPHTAALLNSCTLL
jgi:hypothetical protein